MSFIRPQPPSPARAPHSVIPARLRLGQRVRVRLPHDPDQTVIDAEVRAVSGGDLWSLAVVVPVSGGEARPSWAFCIKPQHFVAVL